MSLLHYVKDKSGKTMKLREVNGRHYPDYPVDSLKHAMDMEAKHDDVLIVTYPKSGTHWVSEILRFLVCGSTDIPFERRVVHFIDKADRDSINNLPLTSPRYFCTHNHADTVSRDFLRKRSKIIYVTRNPRDVVTSYFHHHKKITSYYEYDGNWDGHMGLFLDGKVDYDSWFEHTKKWEECIEEHQDNPFLVLSYESLKEDPLCSVKKLSAFIEMDYNEEFLKEIVAMISFESMFQIREREKAENLVLFRKGQVGDWKNSFTVAQSEMFDEIFETEMAGTNAHKLYSHTVET